MARSGCAMQSRSTRARVSRAYVYVYVYVYAARLRVSVVRAHHSIGFRFLLFGMGSATYIASRIQNYSSKLELMAPDLHVYKSILESIA